MRVRALDYFEFAKLGRNIEALAQIAGRGETLSLVESLAHSWKSRWRDGITTGEYNPRADLLQAKDTSFNTGEIGLEARSGLI